MMLAEAPLDGLLLDFTGWRPEEQVGAEAGGAQGQDAVVAGCGDVAAASHGAGPRACSVAAVRRHAGRRRRAGGASRPRPGCGRERCIGCLGAGGSAADDDLARLGPLGDRIRRVSTPAV
ncbi:hypothetical protein GCM10022295_82210 [Streptomyces osmaniensis]|uniref:Uncharacterized protein n=1 Tax=Streptomyces osmaniensis TaxID=593134 RepID=A0ABP6YQK5_9ACTN